MRRDNLQVHKHPNENRYSKCNKASERYELDYTVAANDNASKFVASRLHQPVDSSVPTLGGGIFPRGRTKSPVNVSNVTVTGVSRSGLDSRRKSPSGCVKQTQARYTSPTRKSPPYPANKCCGERMIGNDGQLYESKRNVLNVCSWRAHHGCQV